MFKTLLAASTIFIAASGFALATVPLLDYSTGANTVTLDQGTSLQFMFADSGNSGSGSNSGSGGDDSHDSNDDDSNDDNSNDDNSNDDNSNDDNDGNTSGRDRPRVPGGSGCDTPEDIAEHSECRV